VDGIRLEQVDAIDLERLDGIVRIRTQALADVSEQEHQTLLDLLDTIRLSLAPANEPAPCGADEVPTGYRLRRKPAPYAGGASGLLSFLVYAAPMSPRGALSSSAARRILTRAGPSGTAA
jgi:hypothetical protein